ncbi:hypothetical protein EDD18DRAFT_1367812 [Armillaria luteobubalina]|uniref:Uncharacterized protein n=1 Tax=Armillaria luteobubalina TaxID=153913 RepID=A0AA39U4U8_9AGAR|nr:hypothetical protein EDD18DRAFT_1367812 [Armillaria luteobubalina]
MEALCPIDRGTLDGQGACVPDICDREINNILAYIYHGKDARITLILDCCFAGGITEALLNGDVRTAHSLPPGSFVRMLNSAKERTEDWHGYRDVWCAEKWTHENMNPYTVLGACEDYQFARECEDGGGYSGVFTRALVKALTSSPLQKEATYYNLIHLLTALLRRNIQHPMLAGDRVRERLWL